MKRSRRQAEKDGAKRFDGSWPCPGYTTRVGRAVHPDRKAALTSMGQELVRSLTIGTALNDSCDTGCTGIRSEQAIVQSIRQK